jgi:hypothetical protein
MAPPREFVFVDQSSGDNVPRCPAVRRKIRQQAMFDAGQRRRKHGNYGQHNLRQYPVFEQKSDEAPAASHTQPHDGPSQTAASQKGPQTRIRSSVRRKPGNHISPPKPATEEEEANGADALEVPALFNAAISAYEKLRAEYNFDLITLSALATSHFGRSSARSIQSDPGRLQFLLQQPEISYLQFIPSRYEESPLLRDVLPCLLAQASGILHPQGPWEDSSVPRLYAKALMSLQAALSDPAFRTHPDVLCATELLSLFEVRCLVVNERRAYSFANNR